MNFVSVYLNLYMHVDIYIYVQNIVKFHISFSNGKSYRSFSGRKCLEGSLIIAMWWQEESQRIVSVGFFEYLLLHGLVSLFSIPPKVCKVKK